MKTKTFFATLLLAAVFVSGVGFAHAQEDDLPPAGMVPGDPFYFLEMIAEGIGTLTTIGNIAKAERHLMLAEERLAEARELANSDRPARADRATLAFEDNLERALNRAEQAQALGTDVDELLEKISDATSKHLAVLSEVLGKVPEEAREGIQNAMEKSVKGRDRARQAILND